MIVQPDFLDHWKTKLLIEITKDPASPLLLLRLWGFCQQRRKATLEGITPEAIKSITHWNGKPSDLLDILTTCGFLKSENGILRAHDWETVNSSLVAKWSGGEATRKLWAEKSQAKAKPGRSRRLKEGRSIAIGLDKTGLDGIGDEKREEGEMPSAPSVPSGNPPSEKGKPSTPQLLEFEGLWDDGYLKFNDRPYVRIWERDRKAIKPLLGTMTPKSIVAIAERAWALRGKEGAFWVDKAQAVTSFVSHLNQIQAEIEKLERAHKAHDPFAYKPQESFNGNL